MTNKPVNEKKQFSPEFDFGFLVEGSTDKNFIDQFLKKFFEHQKIKYNVKRINDGEGKSSFFKDGNIESYLLKIANIQKTFTLILIVDADSELETKRGQPAGFKEVDKKLKEIIKEIKSNDFYQNVKILYYIMPFHDEQHFGQLEDLFVKSLKKDYQKKLDECLKPFQKCLRKQHPKPEIAENKMPKIQMEILLKSFDKNLSKDNLTEWIDYNHESLNNFKKFLKEEVFRIIPNKK